MTLRSRLGIAMVALGLLGCARARHEPVAPSPRAVAPLSSAMLGTSAGGLVDGDALDRLFGAPEVAAAGERLLDRLGQEPSLAPLYDEFLATLLGQPALMESLAAMAASNPETSLDELTAKVMARLSAGIDGPAFDAALDGSLDRLLDRPPIDAAFGRMAEAMVERSRFEARLAALMMQWQPELETAVGVPMSDERFGARLEQHLAAPAREGALSRLFSERIADDAGLRQELAALLDDDAFVGACASLVRTLLASPGVHESTAAVIIGMLEEVDAEALGRRVDRVLLTPTLEAAVVKWTDEVASSAAFARLAGRLGLVLEDPNLQAELFAIVVGGAAGPTA